MLPVKAILSLVAVTLTIVGYVPYIAGIVRKRNKPHLFTWFNWTLNGVVIFALQFTHGAGLGSLVALAAVILSFIVLVLTVRAKGKRDITLIDGVFSLISLTSIVIWIFAKQPVISAFLVMAADMLGFFPTIRKSWSHPFEENITMYAVNILMFMFALAALQEYSLITMLYPVTWFTANLLFTLMLLVRRRAQSLQ